MKKYLVAAALVGIMSFTGFSLVSARGNYGHGPGMEYGYGNGMGYGNCDGYIYCNNRAYGGPNNEKVAAFLKETTETRKQLAVKRSERRALMSQDNPDEKKVGQLTGEIFDLKNLLDEKATEVFGDNPPMGFRRAWGSPGNCGRRPRHF